MDLHEQAAFQLGLITRDQALYYGLSSSAIGRKVASGNWVLERFNVYRIGGAPKTWMQQLLALQLASSSVVVSHCSAARLFGLLQTDELEVSTIGRSAPRWLDVRIHRIPQLPKEFRTHVNGIPVTTPARTVVDLSTCLTDKSLSAVLDEVVRKGLASVSAVEHAANSLAAGRSRKLSVVKAVVSERQATESPIERRVLKWIRSAGLPAPHLQYALRVRGRNYRFDMAYPEQRLAIEVDGYEFHSGRLRFDADRERDATCQSAGWHVYRFTSSSERQFVVSTVKQALAQDLWARRSR